MQGAQLSPRPPQARFPGALTRLLSFLTRAIRAIAAASSMLRATANTRFASASAFAFACALMTACSRKHVPIDPPTELPYPACDGGPPAAVVAEGRLRDGPYMNEKNVVETFALRRESCRYVLDGREAWPRMIADFQVVYDENLLPLRAWKRMTIPGVARADGNADIRRYELRTPDVVVKRRDSDGRITFEQIKIGGKAPPPEGTRIAAVIGPGRGMLTAWIQRAKLPVGGKVRDLVLDFRAMVETVSAVTLKREDDQFEPSLGRNVRVYTVYGRESVFTDENNVVIGDLAGMRPSASLTTPEPPPLPTYGAPDPIGTP